MVWLPCNTGGKRNGHWVVYNSTISRTREPCMLSLLDGYVVRHTGTVYIRNISLTSKVCHKLLTAWKVNKQI